MHPFSSAMNLVGRVLLALLFIQSGPGKIANAAATATFMAASGLPNSTFAALLVGVFELLAGLALAVGFKTRFVALALAVFTLLASLLFHAYWAAPADQQFIQQLLFLKNLAVAGGLLFVASAGAGPWSWDAWRIAAVRTPESESN